MQKISKNVILKMLGLCHESINELQSAIEYLKKFRVVTEEQRSTEETPQVKA
jgi:hypothetical protein